MATGQGCRVSEVQLERGVPALLLENEAIAVTVIPLKGADIYRLVAKPEGLDVLWKSPWGLQPLVGGTAAAFSSAVTWSDAYEGGWQEIFPNGGQAGMYKGVELNFHGEASTSAWDVDEVLSVAEAASIRLSTRLRRSPFRIEREMRLEGDRPVLQLRERITNEGGEPVEYMWGHHPAYGAPFLSGACRIDTNAATVWADDETDGPHNPLQPNGTFPWPRGERDGVETDLSVVPAAGGPPRQLMGFFRDFPGSHGWYGITNPELGIGVGMVWPVDVFPFAWYWQEMHASAGFPWYKGVYTMAIEPFTSIPGGLTRVIEKTQTQRSLAAGESLDVELAAVLYRSRTGITGIAPNGDVSVR
ncbi:MAG: aldose 1-epimerase [Chloroflexota bacterium]|nr:aldose 1-epimerase [Chloroflexota bacterium]